MLPRRRLRRPAQHRETERFIDDVQFVACPLSDKPSQPEK